MTGFRLWEDPLVAVGQQGTAVKMERTLKAELAGRAHPVSTPPPSQTQVTVTPQLRADADPPHRPHQVIFFKHTGLRVNPKRLHNGTVDLLSQLRCRHDTQGRFSNSILKELSCEGCRTEDGWVGREAASLLTFNLSSYLFDFITWQIHVGFDLKDSCATGKMSLL